MTKNWDFKQGKEKKHYGRFCQRCRKALKTDSGEPCFITTDRHDNVIISCAKCYLAKAGTENRGSPTIRQRRAIKYLLQGFPPASALRLAGYSKQTRENIKGWLAATGVQKLLTEHGIMLIKQNPHPHDPSTGRLTTSWEAALEVKPTTKDETEPKAEVGFSTMWKQQEEQEFKDWQEEFELDEKRKLRKAIKSFPDIFCQKCKRIIGEQEPIFRLVGKFVCSNCKFPQYRKFGRLPTLRQRQVVKNILAGVKPISKAIKLAGSEPQTKSWLKRRGFRLALEQAELEVYQDKKGRYQARPKIEEKPK